MAMAAESSVHGGWLSQQSVRARLDAVSVCSDEAARFMGGWRVRPVVQAHPAMAVPAVAVSTKSGTPPAYNPAYHLRVISVIRTGILT
jgi:hypothetical protein